MNNERRQAKKIEATIVIWSGTTSAYNITVANTVGPASSGMASGTINGSPFGKLERKLDLDGNKIFTAIRNRIIPEAKRTVGVAIPSKLNK